MKDQRQRRGAPGSLFPQAPSRLGAALAALICCWPAAAAAAVPPDAALYHYARGRVAAGQDQIPEASRTFSAALAADRADPAVRARNFEVALVAGDQRTAFRLAELIPPGGMAEVQGSRFGFNDAITAMTRVTAAALLRDWRGFDRAREAFPESQAGAAPVVKTILDAWGHVGRGDVNGALALLDGPEAGGMARSYFLEHRAHVLAAGRRWREAAEAYGQLVAGDGANVPRLRLQAAAAALEAGRATASERDSYRARAIALLGGGPARDPLLLDARARLAANPSMDGRALLAGMSMGPAEGMAQLMMRLAVEASRERPTPLSIAFGRFATFLNPSLPEAWLVTGEALARNGLPELALAAFGRVPPGPYRRLGEIREAQAIAQAGRTEEALARFRALAAQSDAGPEDWVRVSDMERALKRPAQVAEALDRAIALVAEPATPDQAYLWFLRGSAHEQAGDWPKAEADLRRSVELQPENPIFLNYLGYSLLDRGMKLDEADALIARAFKAAPDNGAIIDSMGWSAFVRGNYAEAVDLLQQARAAEPADPTVADHLGDALWKVGRRIEARQAWMSALSLDPDDKQRPKIRKKIDFGLDLAVAER
ncbi:tetratricopeptide repeat protein [Thermaurantiacus sp.]